MSGRPGMRVVGSSVSELFNIGRPRMHELNNVIGAGFVFTFATVGAAFASSGENHDPQVSDQMSQSGFVLENGLAIPAFDPKKGRLLFGSKGCVVCHSINGIGGEDAVEFSAEWMEPPMNATCPRRSRAKRIHDAASAPRGCT